MKTLTLTDRILRRIKTEGLLATLERAQKHVNKKLKKPFIERCILSPNLEAAVIEITNACNLRCPMCMASETRLKGGKIRFIEPVFFKRVIDELAKLQVYRVCLNFGGESLLHPNFPELLEYACAARKRGIGSIDWIDNGMLFDSKTANLTVKLNVDSIMFSLDMLGHDHDKWRVGSNYDVIASNIKKLVQIRGEKKKPKIIINKIDVENAQQTNRFIDYWTRIVDVVIVSPLNKPHFRIHGKYFGDMPTITHKYCNFPFTTVGILADGRISACSCDDNALNTMGNLNDSSLEAIWKSEAYKSFRRETVTRKYLSYRPCNVCDVWLTSFKPSIADVGNDLQVIFGNTKEYYVKSLKTT